MPLETQASQKDDPKAVAYRGGRLSWILLLCASAVMAYYVVFDRVDDKLTSEIQSRLRHAFPEHYVTVDRARLVPGESIVIDGLRICKSTEQGLRDVVKVSRVSCNGPIDLVGIIQGQVVINNVLIDGLELSIWPKLDGTWSIAELSRKPTAAVRLPAVQVRSGLVRLGHQTGEQQREIICHDLQGTFIEHIEPTNDPGVQRLRHELHATLSSSYFSRLQIDATGNLATSQWDVQGSMDRLDFSSQLCDQLPVVIRDRLELIRGFSGRLEARFGLKVNRGKYDVQAQIKLQEGRLLNPQVPYPLDQISGDLFVKNDLLQLRNAVGRSGKAALALEFDMQGLGKQSPIAAKLSVRNLALDEQLYNALPGSIQEQWRKLGVKGTVHASAAIRFDGRNWDPHLVVRAVDGSIDADFFPYPLERLSGDFEYRDGVIQAPSLVAYTGQQRLHGSLTLRKAQPRWLMDLSIGADGPIPIDEPLLNALTARGMPESGFQRFAKSLHPTGTVLVKQARFVRSEAKPELISRTLELTFSECSIRYDGFRYPIYEINGQVTLDHDRLIVKDFVGRNDGARIQGSGVANCSSSSLESIDLVFQAFQVSLDEELQQALPPSARNLWVQLQPTGLIDKVEVKIQRASPRSPLDLKVAIQESRSNDHAGRGMSLHPLSFPYAMHHIDCVVDYRPGRIDIRSLSGVHDASRIETNGQIRLHSDGSWDGMLHWLPSSRLVVDQFLTGCLPAVLKEPMTRWSFRGPVSVTGSTYVASPEEGHASLLRDWNLRFDLEDASIGGDKVRGLRGTIQVSGENSNQTTTAYGSLALDALSLDGVAVTGVQGPFAINNNRLYFGRDSSEWQSRNSTGRRLASTSSPASDAPVVSASFQSKVREGFVDRRDQSSTTWFGPKPTPKFEAPVMDISDNDIKARALSGTVFLSGYVPLDGERSHVRCRLFDSDVHGMLVDLGEVQAALNGRLYVQCDLDGSLSNRESLSGSGKAWLRGANLYELPVMIRLLNLLSVRPDQGAFDSADIDFAIDGDRIPINNLQLDGDLISMQGKGTVNFRQELDLELVANVGRRGIVGAIVRPFTQNQNANWMRIEVGGTTSNPQIRPPMPLRDSIDSVLIESP
jgi:hypothetical protein